MRQSGLILPPGADPHADLRRIVNAHNHALQHLHPEQEKAFNRILLATMIVRTMVGENAPPEVQQAAAQEALAEVMRREANGQTLDMVMWRTPVQLTDQNLDDLVKRTKDGG